MDHPEAIRLGAVERYLLQELSPSEREEFEEHFFACQECAAELKVTAAFLDGAKKAFEGELEARGDLGARRVMQAKPVRPLRATTRFAWLWTPAVLSPACAVLLLIIGYQNMVVLPRSRDGVARVETPEVLASISLIGSNSRGGTEPSASVASDQPLLLSLDIPTDPRFASYTCVLENPSGAVLWRVPVSASAAKDTVSIHLPAARWESGSYSLIVQGNASADAMASAAQAAAGGPQPTDLTRYRFTLDGSLNSHSR